MSNFNYEPPKTLKLACNEYFLGLISSEAPYEIHEAIKRAYYCGACFAAKMIAEGIPVQEEVETIIREAQSGYKPLYFNGEQIG